ncbi:hypothetical protein [Roseomonas sp. KE2513]|uniref:hypothetical protein n=1 Tax=Roseomonas sp. KE2513 TaxID=2479202 RepID=UPI0018E05A94|nr:hypothetical protein [Roseomonas sp. KE2513]
MTQVDNFSLGHSTSVVLPLSLHRFEPSKFDFCIFDFAVNEEGMIRSHPERADQIAQRLSGMLERFHGTSCVPVILIMPCHLGLNQECLGRKLYIEFATNNNLPFFDGYEYLEQLQAGSVLSHMDLFRDPDHIAQWPAYALGFILAKQLNWLKEQHIHLGSKLTRLPEFTYLRAATELTDLPGDVIHRRNSLVADSFLKLSGVATHEIRLSRPGTLIGLGLDLAGTNARIALSSGDKRVLLDFGTNYFDPTGEKMTFVVRPVFPQLPVDTSFQITTVQRESIRCSDLYLHGFSIQMLERPSKVLSISPTEIDLAGLVQRNDIREGILAAQALLRK